MIPKKSKKMGKDFTTPTETDIELNIELIENEQGAENEKLQRTVKWKQTRSGNWTSAIKKGLMSCSQSSGKKSWNEKEKVYDFGKTALKAIYNAAMQRKTGRYIESGDGTKKMQYGTKVEPLIFTIAAEKLKHLGTLTEVGFKFFDDVPTAGVSADGVLKTTMDKLIAVYEAKACTNWETHFDRTFDLMDEKGNDFWQTQDHMVAYNVNTCYYAVAEPPQDINKYLYYEGDIMDLLDDFRNECDVTIQELHASEMHQNAGLKRIEIAEKIIEIWNSKGGDLRKIMYEVIESYKIGERDSFVGLTAKEATDGIIELGKAFDLPKKIIPKIEPEEAFDEPKLEPEEVFSNNPNKLNLRIEEEINPDDLPF